MKISTPLNSQSQGKTATFYPRSIADFITAVCSRSSKFKMHRTRTFEADVIRKLHWFESVISLRNWNLGRRSNVGLCTCVICIRLKYSKTLMSLCRALINSYMMKSWTITWILFNTEHAHLLILNKTVQTHQAESVLVNGINKTEWGIVVCT